MRALAMLLCLLVLGCDPSDPPSDGGGEVDSGFLEGDFSVRVEQEGAVLDDASEVRVTFGCQGGSHIELDVFATDDAPMPGARVRIEVFGAPLPIDYSFRLAESPAGAEGLLIIAPFGDLMTFSGPGDFGFPATVTLRLTVTDAAGASVRLERGVTLVQGAGCTCSSNNVGLAVVGAFDVTGAGVDCEPVSVSVEIAFTTTDGRMLFFPPLTTHQFDWPARCVDALMLAVGAELPLTYNEGFPGQGCTPFFVGPTFDDFTCDCPPPGG